MHTSTFLSCLRSSRKSGRSDALPREMFHDDLLTITYLCWIGSKVGKSIRLNFLAQYAYPEPRLLIASPREATHDGDRRQILDATPSRNETDATRVVLSQGVVHGPFGPLNSYH